MVHMNTVANGQSGAKPFFDATLQLERRPWEGRELHRVLAAYLLMMLRVIGAIHWEALKFWGKRVPVVPHRGKIGDLAG